MSIITEGIGTDEQAMPDMLRSSFDIVWMADDAAARAAALEDASDNDGHMVPGDLSKSSGRRQFAATITLTRTVSISSPVRVSKKIMQAGESTDTQRPVDESHVLEIARYFEERVEQERPYWFGQLSFNAHEDDRITIYAAKTKAIASRAYAVIRPNTKLYPVDGNHRLHAFIRLKDAGKSGGRTWDAIANDCIQVCVIDEPDSDVARQLFVDAAQAKPLPPSLLVSFSSLNQFPSFVKEVAVGTPIFLGRIDHLSRSLGKNPKYILTMNQLRMILAEFAFGTTKRRAVDDLSKMFDNPVVRSQFVCDTIEFWKNFAQASGGIWVDLLSGGAVNLYDARLKRVDFTTSGLQIIARLGHDIYSDIVSADKRPEYVARLAGLSFDRDAEIWMNTLIKMPGYRIATQSGDIAAAYDKAKAAIGLPAGTRTTP